jgi:cytochrome bd-type quinol oxidase subunit 2
MERVLVVAFGAALVLICLFWTYGYFRKRSKGRF